MKKKLLPLFFLIFLLSLLFCSCALNAQEGVLTDPAALPPAVLPPAARLPDFMLLPGSYVAGINIPEGEYVLTATGEVSGYFEIFSGEQLVSGSFDRQYVILRGGEELFFRDSVLLVMSDAPVEIDAEGGYLSGMYKVGAHIPAGAYTFFPAGVSSYFVTKNPLYDLDYVLTGTTAEPVIIYLTEGQYITLNGGSLRFNGEL